MNKKDNKSCSALWHFLPMTCFSRPFLNHPALLKGICNIAGNNLVFFELAILDSMAQQSDRQ